MPDCANKQLNTTNARWRAACRSLPGALVLGGSGACGDICLVCSAVRPQRGALWALSVSKCPPQAYCQGRLLGPPGSPPPPHSGCFMSAPPCVNYSKLGWFIWTPTLNDLEHLYHVHLVHEPTKRAHRKQPFGCHAHSSDGSPQHDIDSVSDGSRGSDSSADTIVHHPLSPIQLSSVIIGTVLTYITWTLMEILHRSIRDSFFQTE